MAVPVSAAALSARPAVPGGRPGLDPDAGALGDAASGWSGRSCRSSQIAPVLPRTVIASEDARFCRHRGIDWAELRDAIEEADDLSRGARRLDHHPADRQEPVPVAGPQLRAQGAGVAAGAVDRPGAAEAADHGNLPQHRRMGPERRVRRRGRRAPCVQQVGAPTLSAARRRCWPRCCRTRTGAAPGSRARRCGGSPASCRAGPPACASRIDCLRCGDSPPSHRNDGASLGGGVPL